MRCPKCLMDNVQQYDVKLKAKSGYENPVKCLTCGYLFAAKIPKNPIRGHLGVQGRNQEVVQVLNGVVTEHFGSIKDAIVKSGLQRYTIEKCMNTGCRDINGYSWRRV